MVRYVVKRLLWLVPVLLIISMLSFSLMYLSPGDPAVIYLSQAGDAPSDEAIAAMREQLGLNRPAWEQYLVWLGGVLRGDMGESIFTGNPVSSELATYFPNTMVLAFLGLALTLIVSVPLGFLCAVRENRVVDLVVRFCSFVCGALPGFFAAMLLIYLLGIQLKVLPTVSSGKPIGIILPALTLALTMSPQYIRQVRAAVINELSQDYVRMMRARGVSVARILFTNVLKSVLPSILTLVGLSLGALLGGTAIIEIVCTYQGIGRLAINSITNRDYPLMQGFVLVTAVVYVLVNLAVDIACAAADPRVRNRVAKRPAALGKRASQRGGANYGRKANRLLRWRG